MRIAKRFTFDAAHRLPLHEGKCSRDHGHTYILEVEIQGPPHCDDSKHSEQGMVFDFARLKAIVMEQVIDRCDHRDLNQIVKQEYGTRLDPETHNVTTAENLALLFAHAIQDKLPPQVTLERLRLHETPDSWAEWSPMNEYQGHEKWLTGRV